MADVQTPQDIVAYYAGLLIKQYAGKPKAAATIAALASVGILPQITVESITFPSVPVSGTFVLNYGLLLTAAINWNDSAATIQTKIRAITGLGSITVTGSIASQSLIVTFNGVPPVALPLVVSANSLMNSGSQLVVPVVTETDEVMPLAVQDAFNLIAPNTAQGVQLDILGKYAGVTKSFVGFTGATLTLSDQDFLSLIHLAITENSSMSTLAAIEQLLFMFFPGEIFVFDYQDMTMSYLISSSVGSMALIEAVIAEDLLPRPMAVRIRGIVYAPVVTTFFGFRTYAAPGFNVSPFNDYASYQTDYPWLSYQNVITV